MFLKESGCHVEYQTPWSFPAVAVLAGGMTAGGVTQAVADPTRAGMDAVAVQERYPALQKVFSPDEIDALAGVSTLAEVAEIARLIEDPSSLGGGWPGDSEGEIFVPYGDGCTMSPDSWGKANFRPSGDRHDYCYSPASYANRLDCDNRFRADLKRECNRAYGAGVKAKTCRGVADVYYGAVRAAGGKFYKGKGLNN